MRRAFQKATEAQRQLDEELSDEPPRDTLEQVARMMNDLRLRREHQLGKYYQMLKRQEIVPEGLEQLFEKQKRESVGLDFQII